MRGVCGMRPGRPRHIMGGMIRRPAGDSFLLITQVDHAAFSGAIAEQLGADWIDEPTPRQEVIAAIGHHDGGWPIHDDEPTRNAQGLPLHVFEINMGLATRIWTESVERAAGLGPYAQLLVSLHQLSLSDYAGRPHDPAGHERVRSRQDLFELNKFQHRQVEVQESLRRQVGLRTDLPLSLGLAKDGVDPAEDRLTFNFRLLTLCDRLSLQLCCGKELFPTIEDVRPRPGAQAAKITTRFVDGETVEVAPWPFKRNRISLEVPYRRVGAAPFESDAALRDACQAAPVEKIELGLRPASE